MDRAQMYASALLRFHFYYGDFIRWMGGEYTNRHRNWDATFDTIIRHWIRVPPPKLPPIDLPRGKMIFTQGVPLKGHFTCPQQEIHKRNVYNNHPANDKNFAAVEETFAKEEQKSFHLYFSRVLVYYVLGMLLNPLQWEWDKGKVVFASMEQGAQMVQTRRGSVILTSQNLPLTIVTNVRQSIIVRCYYGS
jgi:hypothetical protein